MAAIKCDRGRSAGLLWDAGNGFAPGRSAELFRRDGILPRTAERRQQLNGCDEERHQNDLGFHVPLRWKPNGHSIRSNRAGLTESLSCKKAVSAASSRPSRPPSTKSTSPISRARSRLPAI